MTIKDYALVDSNNNVVNTIVMNSDKSIETFTIIAEANGAVAWYDFETYGETSIGGFFNGTVLVISKPYASWIKGVTDWEAPVEYPNDGKNYMWDEGILSWELAQID